MLNVNNGTDNSLINNFSEKRNSTATIFVDEAGTLEFRKEHPVNKRAYVACAVLIPASSYQQIERILPVTKGVYLKSSDEDLKDSVVTRFLSEILKTRCTTTFISLDLGLPNNVDAAKRVAHMANQFRKRQGQRANTPQHYQYMSCTIRPILTSLG